MKLITYSILIIAAITFSCEMKPKPASNMQESFGGNPHYEINSELVTKLDGTRFSGKAEICTYQLTKARYDSVHKGEAILIQVVEPFLYEEQVKNDRNLSKKSFNVLKSNYFERFNTGVYDYSIMTSTFTPLKYDTTRHSIKITNTVQDWCGQTFMQLNNRFKFDYTLNSYFEKESDSTFSTEKAWQEDEMMNIIRLSLDILPKDSFNIVPKLSYLRTAHFSPKTYKAIATLEKNADTLSNGNLIYSYTIPALKKTVKYFINEQENNTIVKFTESYPTIFDGEIRTTTAELKKKAKLAYWNMNEPKDVKFRDSLLLE